MACRIQDILVDLSIEELKDLKKFVIVLIKEKKEEENEKVFF